MLLLLACFHLAYASATAGPAANASNVPDDLAPIKIEGTTGFYAFGQGAVNWYVAYENCRKLGAELVTFETDEEFDLVAGFLKSRGIRSEYWTSGNDLGKTGTHNWFTNGRRMEINRWAPHQPDNDGGREHCVHLGYIYRSSSEIQLNDRPCSEDGASLFNFICEGSA